MHNELTDVLRHGRSAWAPVRAAIALGCDEVAVPAQKRGGCGNGGNLGQRLAAQSLSLNGEPTPVVVRSAENDVEVKRVRQLFLPALGRMMFNGPSLNQPGSSVIATT